MGAEKLEKLLTMPIPRRMEAIVKDLVTRTDEYREIDAHDLAEALGISDAWNPGGDWQFTTSAEKQSIEEYLQDNCDPPSELLYLIEDKISDDRFQHLLNLCSEIEVVNNSTLHFLTPEERDLLEEAIAYRELESRLENGLGCVARYSLQTDSGYALSFEGQIEDDGACINLKTPYDDREGEFADFRDCVTESW